MTQPSRDPIRTSPVALLPPGPPTSPGDGCCRVGDLERSRVCDALAEHYAAGRLRGDELEHRLGRAVQAVTVEDLVRLTVDLPSLTGGERPRPATASAAAHRSWPASVVVAVVVLLVGVLVAGGMLLVLGMVSPLLFLGALLGGSAAMVAGGSATFLLAACVRRAPQPAAARSPAAR